MSQLRFKRPGMRTQSKSTPGNFFLNVELDGKPERVIMTADSEVTKDWSNIKFLTIAKVHYSMGRDPENPKSEPSTDFPFDRVEVIDYETGDYIVGNLKFDQECAKYTVVQLKDAVLSSELVDDLIS